MQAQPEYWRKYYCDFDKEYFDLQFSLSDRIRYYWPHPEIQRAQEIMLKNLEREAPPLTLLSQYLPDQYQAIRARRLPTTPKDILIEGVAKVLRQYMHAVVEHTPATTVSTTASTTLVEPVTC
jgi:D-tagatose-1,6-bisphosphate aldolase subunit GatZ/KbaZ